MIGQAGFSEIVLSWRGSNLDGPREEDLEASSASHQIETSRD